MARKVTYYKCEVCGEVYDSEEVADNCAIVDETCRCQKGKGIILLDNRDIGNGQTLVSQVDAKSKVVTTYVMEDTTNRYGINNVEIQYCPLCGRKL